MLIHTIAAVILKIAYLIVGCLLCFMGQRLLEKGVEGRTKLAGEVAGKKWVLLTSSPGIVFAVCGLGVIIYAIITPTVYEEKSDFAHHDHLSSDIQASTETAQQPSTKSSRLFEQPSEDAALRSRIAIYSLQRKSIGLLDQDVAPLIRQMPTKADAEPWSSTYQRFGDILRMNPSALSKMLNQPKFSWLSSKDQKDRSLSALVESESERLRSAVKTGEVE